MTSENISIEVMVTGLDVPLMIIVDENNHVKVFEKGTEIKNLRQIDFHSGTDELPSIRYDKFIRRNEK